MLSSALTLIITNDNIIKEKGCYIMNQNIFGINLLEMRKQKKLSQKELSEIIGIAPVTISSYEKGAKLPSLDIALRIADFFKVSLDVLCGKEDSKIITVEDFFVQFVNLAKTPAIKATHDDLGKEFFCFDYALADLQSGLFKMLELYKTGVIDENTLNTWVKGKQKEYSGIDLQEYINTSHEQECEKITGGELNDTDY